jgi:BirA family biotin operon repressor/biotin-[acetyl-CoA-carboxylase] ligase
VFETLVSTNQTLWELMNQGAIAGTGVLALRQESGRGQWGRQWQSPPGGLYLSVALTPNLPLENSAQLTLCSAWGIAMALRSYGVPVQLKWPNDLVISGRKLGGLLTETRLYQGRVTKAVVGVGINWTNSVPETGINLQTVLAAPAQPAIASLEMLSAIALQGIASGYAVWQQEGIENLLPSYLSLLTSLGRSISIDDIQGTIVGVSAQGELRIRSHRAEVASGEILLKPGTISLGYDA